MKTTIIVIGDELLIGQVTDTNSGMIARLMAPHGWEVEQVMTVADDREAIREAVGRALDSTPVVLTTGGLGPTKDDITKAVLTDTFSECLVPSCGISRHTSAASTTSCPTPLTSCPATTA